jgi:hypothetical protein
MNSTKKTIDVFPIIPSTVKILDGKYEMSDLDSNQNLFIHLYTKRNLA